MCNHGGCPHHRSVQNSLQDDFTGYHLVLVLLQKQNHLQQSLLFICLVLISFFFSPSNSCSLVVGCWGKTSEAVGDSECVTGGMVSEPCTSEGCSNPQLITAGLVQWEIGVDVGQMATLCCWDHCWWLV